MRQRLMRYSTELIAGLLFLAAFMIFNIGNRADAAPGVASSSAGSSCVASFRGVNSGLTSINFSGGVTVDFKCYYSSTAPSGFAGYITSAFTTTTTTNCVTWGYGATGAGLSNMASNTTPMGASGIATTAVGTGYIAGVLTFVRNSGSTTFTWDNSKLGIIMDPDCSGYSTGSDRRCLGSSTLTGACGSATGPTCVAPSSNGLVAANDFAVSSPCWQWQGVYTQAVPFCGASVTLTVNGAAATATTVILPGDSLVFSTSWTSTRTDTVRAYFPGFNVDTGDFYRNATYRQIYTAGAIANPYVAPTFAAPLPSTYALGGTQIFTASGINLSCYDVLLGQTFYVPFGTATDYANNGRPRPCDLARWYWPVQQQVAVSQVLTWTLVFSGTPRDGLSSTSITIESATYDEASATPARPQSGATWLSTLTWSTVASAIPLGTNSTYNVTAAYVGSVSQFFFRCTDTLGVVYSQQWLSTVRVANATPPESEGSCFAQTGFGINPSSWVPGLVRLGSCVVKALFIPSNASTTQLYNAGQDVTTKAPIIYIAQSAALVYTSVGSASASVDSHTGDPIALLGRSPTITAGRPGHTVTYHLWTNAGSLTGSPSSLDTSGNIATIRTLLGVLFWIGAGWTLALATRKVLVSG